MGSRMSWLPEGLRLRRHSAMPWQSVGVYLGNGDGTFQSPVILQAGNDPFGVWVADFNNDTKPDIVVANGKDATLSMFPEMRMGRSARRSFPAMGLRQQRTRWSKRIWRLETSTATGNRM